MRKKMFIISILSVVIVLLTACSAGGVDPIEKQYEVEPIENQYEVEPTEAEVEKIEIHRDYFILGDVEEMADLATDIISGKVIDRRVEWVNLNPPRENVEEYMLNQGMSQEEIDFELYGIGFEPDFELMTVYRIQVLEVFQGNLVAGEIIEVMRRGGEYENQYWFVADATELVVDTELVLFLFSRRLTNNPFVLVSHIQGVYYVPSSLGEYEYLMEYDNIELELEKASELDPVTVTIEDLINIAEENGLLEE